MLFVTGDTHGDFDDLATRGINRLKKGDKLLITGDFGFWWDNSKEEQKNRKKLSKKKFDILFVEGAAENLDLLSDCEEVDFCGAKAKKLADNIFMLERGEIYQIEGKTVFALGGGLNPYLEPENTEGAASMPTDEELEYAVENIKNHQFKVDLILTHEAPASMKNLIDRNAFQNDLNIFLDTVLRNTAFKHWYFGSLHQDRAVSRNITCVFEEIVAVKC